MSVVEKANMFGIYLYEHFQPDYIFFYINLTPIGNKSLESTLTVIFLSS